MLFIIYEGYALKPAKDKGEIFEGSALKLPQGGVLDPFPKISLTT
jgi:hypothetical protein